MQPRRLAHILTYLGSLPLILAVLLAAYGSFNLGDVFGYQLKFSRFKSYALAHSYGAVIVAFLAGIQWGISLPNEANKQYFISSNVLALSAWFSLFLFAQWAGLLWLLLNFVWAFVIDHHAHRSQMIPTWFWQLRQRISLLVVILLMVLLLINR